MTQTPITNQQVQLLETIVSSSEQMQDYFVPFAVDESILHHLVQFPSETFLHFLGNGRYSDFRNDRY